MLVNGTSYNEAISELAKAKSETLDLQSKYELSTVDLTKAIEDCKFESYHDNKEKLVKLRDEAKVAAELLKHATC